MLFPKTGRVYQCSRDIDESSCLFHDGLDCVLELTSFRSQVVAIGGHRRVAAERMALSGLKYRVRLTDTDLASTLLNVGA